MSDATRRDNDATEAVEWLDVKAAAIRLNISERSVQRWASAGELPSQMDGRRLLVCVPTLTDVVNEAANSDATEPEVSRHDASNGESVATSALLEQMQGEVAYLRSELSAEREARVRGDREFRELLLRQNTEIARLQQENRLLLAAPPVEKLDVAVQDVQEGTQEARTDALETNAGISAPVAETSRKSEDTPIGATLEKSAQETVRPRRWWEVWRK